MRPAAALGVLALVSLVLGGVSGRLFPGWMGAALLALAAFASWRRRAGGSAGDASVALDEQVISVLAPGAPPRSVPWSQLVEVGVLTTEDGPLADDVFLVLRGADGSGCVVPNSIAMELVGRLVRLPGFDHQAFIQAMSSTGKASFVCWKGSPGDALVAAQSLPGETPPAG